jgi:hypothetical protein
MYFITCHVFSNSFHRRRMMRVTILFLSSLVFLVPRTVASQSIEGKINEYMFRIKFRVEEWRGSLEILRNNQRVHYVEGGRFTVNTGAKVSNLPVAGKDITGDGTPDLVVEENSGGAHCCYSYVILSLGSELKKLAEIHSDDSQLKFEDIDNDGIYELISRDWTFAYWETSFANSPAPTVIFRLKDTIYQFASDLMKKPAPQPEEISAWVADVKRSMDATPQEASQQDKRWAGGGVPSLLWNYMLQLIYSGNGEAAWKFIDSAWPQSRPGKQEFLDAFKRQLANSRYWQDLKALNGW